MTEEKKENKSVSVFSRSDISLESDPLEEIFALNLGDFISEHLISDYLGSLKNVCKSFKKFFGITVSHQTIENWLFVNENILEFDLWRCSGYYVFDVEWIKINGKWKQTGHKKSTKNDQKQQNYHLHT